MNKLFLVIFLLTPFFTINANEGMWEPSQLTNIEEDILKAKHEVDVYLDELDKDEPELKKAVKIDNYLTPGWNEELDNLEIFNLDDE